MKAVIYTRVSTDKQSKDSHDDQARVCERFAKREKWTILRRYTDDGISGTKNLARADYQAMLAAGKEHEFDVLIVDELSRFSRDLVGQEQAIVRLEYAGIRVVAVNDNYDSLSRGRKLHRRMKGMMNAEYVDVIRYETHRGLEGVARKGLSVGGRAYGYRHIPIIGPDGMKKGAHIEIAEDQAAIVREIFTRYANGESPRSIAAVLNARGVPSPGASWKRSVRRKDGKWMSTAIYGDPKRSSGILNNQLYCGVRIWNRTRRDEDPDTEKTVFKRRPDDERVEVQVPHLRIVPQELWDKVRSRQRSLSAQIGARITAGMSKFAAAGQVGAVQRNEKYLFSGLLTCGVCNRRYSVSGPSQSYTCGSRTLGGKDACENKLRIPRLKLESILLPSIQEQLLSDEALAAFKSDVRDLLKTQRKETAAAQQARLNRVNALRKEVENLADAVAMGQLRTSTTLAARLEKAEIELAAAESETVMDEKQVAKVEEMMPRVADRLRRMVADLPTALQGNMAAARIEVAALLGGPIKLYPDPTGSHLIAHYGVNRHALLWRCLGKAAGPVTARAAGKKPMYTGVGSGGRI